MERGREEGRERERRGRQRERESGEVEKQRKMVHGGIIQERLTWSHALYQLDTNAHTHKHTHIASHTCPPA